MAGKPREHVDETTSMLPTVPRSRSRWSSRRPDAIVLAAAVFTTAVIILVLSCLWLIPAYEHDEYQPRPPAVNLNYTRYEGLRLPHGVDAFLGMRYAAAPVENLRWRAPVEPPQTTGIQKADRFPPICLGMGAGYPVYGQDEDCLFVNVWTPSNATSESKLPVWVFIGGGGYVALTNANWNGAEVVRKSGHNIVMVNFNYRVGLWGFLASERVRDDGDLNVGLLDQRMLLLWVRKHIAQFGGNPDHVVIHGASAGAGSVAMHMVAHGGRNDGLFVGAMAESIFFPAQPRVYELEYQFDRVIRQTGCDRMPGSKQMACLRDKDAVALQSTNVAQPFPGRRAPPVPLFYWTPCIDGSFLEDLPYTLFREGRFVEVPVLLGTDTDEGSIFAPDAASPDAVSVFLANNYPKLTPNHTAAILARYASAGPLPPLPQHAPWFPTASLAYGEATFVCPNLNVLNYLSSSSSSSASSANLKKKGGNARFAYRYNVLDSENLASGLGVPHLFEAAAIFGPDSIGHARASYHSYNAPIVPVVMSYWISFVRALDPNVFSELGSPYWDTWGKKEERLVFELGGVRMEGVGMEEKGRCEFWRGLGEVMEQKM